MQWEGREGVCRSGPPSLLHPVEPLTGLATPATLTTTTDHMTLNELTYIISGVAILLSLLSMGITALTIILLCKKP